jgi:hypothetical protein
MTSLRHYCSEEIASAMSAQLNDTGFTGLYRKAEEAWWQKGPASQAFKAEMDATKTADEATAVHNKWLASGSEGATKLGKEHDDFSPLIDYSENHRAQLGEQQAKDGPCPKCGEAPCSCHETECECPACADAADGANLAVAIDFAIRHVVKVADALDKAGFVGVAGALDETLQKLAAARPIISEAKKKHRGRTHGEWVSFLKKHDKKVAERFKKTYEGALEEAKEKKGLKGKKAEEYAMRTAIDHVPEKYLKEPTPEHGKGKSGPLTTKR